MDTELEKLQQEIENLKKDTNDSDRLILALDKLNKKIEDERDNLQLEFDDFKNGDAKETEKVVILKKKSYKSFDSLNIPLLEILMYLPYEKLRDITDKKAVSKEYKDY